MFARHSTANAIAARDNENLPQPATVVRLVAMSKWVEISAREQPAAEIAAETLRQRLEVVCQMLPLAAHEYQDDVEYVHQLRVGCRRAGAALQAFRPLLRGKSKRVRKWLRKIRRAAGPARDIDVLLSRIKAEPKSTPGKKYVLARLKRQRIDVQPALVAIAAKAQQGQFTKCIDRSIAALQKKSSKANAVRFDDFAHEALPSASQGVFRWAGIEQPTVAQLHQLRIASKRLRYSIELFHGAFSPNLREEVYPIVEKIQSRLGQLNDHATAQTLFQQWLAKLPPDERAARLAARIVEEHEAADQIRVDFLHWWTDKRVAALEAQLSALIQAN